MHASLSRTSLVLTLFFAPASFVAAQTKIDLTPFYFTDDQVGDTRVYQSESGPERRLELVELGTVGKKIREVVRYYEADEQTSTQESFTVPGKKFLTGDIWWPSGGEADVKPKVWMPLRMVPGKPYRFRVGARLFYLGQRAGKARFEGTTTFVGIEAHETPVFSLKETARFSGTRRMTYRIPGAPLLVRTSEFTDWLAPGIGTIAYRERTRSYEDGVLVDDTGEEEYWLASGVFGGEPLP